MPNQTIDLSRDCEAWYDFDTDYFNSQRGQIQDRSGHGRHAKAFGGPTVGVEGPDSFEAASFDEVDDKFEIDGPVISGDFTVATYFRLPSQGRRTHTSLSGSSDVALVARDGNSIKIEYVNTNSNFNSIDIFGATSGDFYHQIVRYDSSDDRVELIVPEINARVVSDNALFPEIKINNYGGRTTTGFGGSVPWGDKIAWGGWWVRSLTDAEIAQLTRLTAPRRSQL